MLFGKSTSINTENCEKARSLALTFDDIIWQFSVRKIANSCFLYYITFQFAQLVSRDRPFCALYGSISNDVAHIKLYYIKD